MVGKRVMDLKWHWHGRATGHDREARGSGWGPFSFPMWIFKRHDIHSQKGRERGGRKYISQYTSLCMARVRESKETLHGSAETSNNEPLLFHHISSSSPNCAASPIDEYEVPYCWRDPEPYAIPFSRLGWLAFNFGRWRSCRSSDSWSNISEVSWEPSPYCCVLRCQ